MGNNINWDVCPRWVKFSSGRESIQLNDITENILNENVKTQKQNSESSFKTGDAIPLPNGSHYHKVSMKHGFREIEKATGPAIRVGRRQHIHLFQDK